MNLNGKNIAIIQLARSGDLVQTANAVRIAKQENPGAHFFLIAREQFVTPVAKILTEAFEDIILIQSIKKDNTQSLFEVRTGLRDTLKSIEALQIDTVFNFTFTKASTYLMSLLKAKSKFGPYRNNLNQIEIKDVWGQYIYSNVLGNTVNPFNLVDLFSFALGVKKFKHPIAVRKSGTAIIVHPFASNDKKRWTTHKWINYLHHLSEEFNQTQIFIIGSNNDREECDHILDHQLIKNRKITGFLGKGSEDILSLFQKTSLFIGHDSLLSHIAAYSQTPSLILSLGSVRPNDTSPYNDMAFNLAPRMNCFPCPLESKCDDYACHDKLDLSLVLNLSKEIYHNGSVTDDFLIKNFDRNYMQQVDLYAHERTEDGLIQYKLNQSLPNTKELFLHFYTVLWQFYLRDLSCNIPYSKVDPNELDTLYHYRLAAEKVKNLYQFACKYSEELGKDLQKQKIDKDKVTNLTIKLSEIDQMLFSVVNAYPYLGPLVNMFFVKKNNADGITPYEITISSQLTHYEAVNMCKALIELLEQTLIYNQYQDAKQEVDV